MIKPSSAIATVLLCFLFAVTLSGCGKSSSAASTTSTTTTSNIAMAVAAGNQQVTVSWEDPDSTSSSNYTYNVYASLTAPDASKKDDGTLIASNVTSPFVHTGLVNGRTYYYFVARVTGSTEGPSSHYASAVPMPATPAAPTKVAIATSIQQSLGAVTLTIPNADSSLTYNVYWKTSSGVTKTNSTKIANAFTISGTSATFIHYNLTNNGNTTYYYVITAVGAGNSESDISQELSAKPSVSAAVTTSPNYTFGSVDSVTATTANQQVSLTWTSLSSLNGVAPTYNIYRNPAGPSGNKIATVSGSSFVDNSLTNGTIYTYWVTAYGNATTPMESTTYTALSVIPQAKVLAAPSAVAASTGDQLVSLSWTKASDPAGGTVKYNLYCTTTLPASGTTQANWSLIGTTTATSFVHSGLVTGKIYYYVITSVSDQSGESAGNWTTSQVSMEL